MQSGELTPFFLRLQVVQPLEVLTPVMIIVEVLKSQMTAVSREASHDLNILESP